MRNAPKLLFSLFAIAGTFLVAGCAGGGDDSIESAPASIYQGSYTGTFRSSLEGEGTVVATIDESGRVVADVTVATGGGGTGQVRGTVQDDGRFSGNTQSSAISSIPITGTMTLTETGATGDFSGEYHGETYTAHLDLTRDAT